MRYGLAHFGHAHLLDEVACMLRRHAAWCMRPFYASEWDTEREILGRDFIGMD
jgi:hypothetical protein